MELASRVSPASEPSGRNQTQGWPGARPVQPMGAALEPPPSAPPLLGPWVPGRKPDTERAPKACARAHAHSHPSPPGRCALGQRPMTLRDERHRHRRGATPDGGGGRGALCLCWEGEGGPCGRDSPCCWDPWLRCAGGSGCGVESSQDTIPALTLRTRGPRSSGSTVYRTPAIGWLWGVCGLSRGRGLGHVRGGAPGPNLALAASLPCSLWLGSGENARCVTLSNCAHLSEPPRLSSTG